MLNVHNRVLHVLLFRTVGFVRSTAKAWTNGSKSQPNGTACLTTLNCRSVLPVASMED